MRRRIAFVGVIGVGVAFLGAGSRLADAPAAAVRPVCGPPGAHTLDQNRQARVYVRSARGRRAVFGCHRARRQPRELGDRTRLRLVNLAGRHAGVVRLDRSGADRQLVVVDLRDGRVEARRSTAGGTFTRVRLDRTGIAAYTLQSPATAGRPTMVAVGSTVDGDYARLPDIDPSVLGLAATSVAFRQGRTFRLVGLDEAEASNGPLLRVGRVRFTAVHRRGTVRRRLLARAGGHGRAVMLGAPTSACLSSTGCDGIDAFQVADRFVAVRDSFYATGESGGEIRVYDLARGGHRTACRSEGLAGSVEAFVLTGTGRVACAIVGDYADLSKNQIRAEGTVLDQGPGIDPDSLTARGGRLVWLHGGVERSAPLPTTG